MEPADVYANVGQSFWLDYIRRRIIQDGELGRLIREDGIRGITSNPTIFEKAITESADYDDALLQQVAQTPDISSKDLYEHVAVEDIQAAADLLAPVYVSSQGRDGFACLEVSPYLADDTEATLAEGRRLFRLVSRPNVMIKVPATPAGIPAIRQLIGEGIPINVTLLFSRAVAREVFEAYLDGLESRLQQHPDADLSKLASVASMFVSRIDTAVNALLEAPGLSFKERSERQRLVGKVAIANAKLAYQDWKQALEGSRFRKLAERGAQPQRLLWASTGSKDRRQRDVVYVEELMGPHTVNTLPPRTLEAFRDHGVAFAMLETGLEEAANVLAEIERLGVSLERVTQELVAQGVASFSTAFDGLLRAIDAKREVVARRPTLPARAKNAREAIEEAPKIAQRKP